jgi:hypothetical protein
MHGREEKMSQIWIAVIGALIMAGGLAGIFYLIIKQNAVIGAKTVQLIAIVLVLPLMLALGGLNVLRSETIGPLIGVIIGYVLSGSWKE